MHRLSPLRRYLGFMVLCRRLPAAELDSARHVITADMAVFDLGPMDSRDAASRGRTAVEGMVAMRGRLPLLSPRDGAALQTGTSSRRSRRAHRAIAKRARRWYKGLRSAVRSHLSAGGRAQPLHDELRPFRELLGSSPSFEEMKERARQFLARVKAGGRLPPVLIQGETGSGKGLLAGSLHNARPQTPGRFLAVNCGAIPETLGESEFFGFARGAHSEARRARAGPFQAAHRGTIFLDEVGLLSEGRPGPAAQGHRGPRGELRSAPRHQFRWTRRVISATNADLWAGRPG